LRRFRVRLKEAIHTHIFWALLNSGMILQKFKRGSNT